jgi:IS5 family transposase
MRPGKRGGDDDASGRSRGEFGTKLHIAIDALDTPARLILRPGQAADVGQGTALPEGLDSQAVIAGKGYDSDGFVERIERNGAWPFTGRERLGHTIATMGEIPSG